MYSWPLRRKVTTSCVLPLFPISSPGARGQQPGAHMPRSRPKPGAGEGPPVAGPSGKARHRGWQDLLRGK